MASYQFLGIPAVMDAFNNRDVECWSLWQSRDMLIKGQGPDDLEAFLKMIEPSGTTAIYTLRIYEDVHDPKEIKSKTDDDGRISFKIFVAGAGRDADRSIIGTHYGYPMPQNEVLTRLKAIEEKLALQETEGEDDEGFNLGKFINGVLSDPNQLEHYMRILQGNNDQQVQRPAIGNITHMGQNSIRSEALAASAEEKMSQPGMSQDRLQRLGNAIDILEGKDSKLVEHLEKLASIATNNPGQFKMLITLLDAS